MKIPALIGALSVTLSLANGAVMAEEAQDPRIAEAKAIVKEFATRLQGELKSALQAGGPVAAIEICQEEAPAIAEDLSQGSQWQVARTSLKTRNPNNAPDAWETEILKQFDARQAAGEDVQPMAHAQVVETAEGKRFRFMKAIPAQDLCLTCHGRNIDPQVIEALDKAYPEDQARGYTTGDVRGAFTLWKPL